MAEPSAEPAADVRLAHSVWLGNGTTALYVALRALDCEGCLVAVQPNVCANVVAAIFASGNRPLFVDIERARLGLDPSALRKVARDVGAVVAVHSYGIPCNIAALREVASVAGCPLIEDCAQAEGAAFSGRPVGSFGDVAVFSYGSGKILDAGGGGRAVAQSPALLGRIAAEAARLPQWDTTTASTNLSTAYKQLYNTHYPAVPISAARDFGHVVAEAGKAILSAPPDVASRVEPRLAGLDAVVSGRRRKASVYDRLLAGLPHAEPIRFPAGSVPWRYNLAVDPGLRDAAFKRLLAEKVPSSTWYPNIARFLPADRYETTAVPNADWLDATVLNLWLDEKTREERIGGFVAALCRTLH